MEGERCMKDEIHLEGNAPADALTDERSEFSHRLASFGLGEKPGRLLEDSPRRGARALPKPLSE